MLATGQLDGSDGSPTAGLMQAADGNFCGVAGRAAAQLSGGWRAFFGCVTVADHHDRAVRANTGKVAITLAGGELTSNTAFQARQPGLLVVCSVSM